MIIHKQLLNFLEIINNRDLDFNPITESELRKHFKNNEYYNIKIFCLNNDLIIISYHSILLSPLGKELFNILKKLRNI